MSEEFNPISNPWGEFDDDEELDPPPRAATLKSDAGHTDPAKGYESPEVSSPSPPSEVLPLAVPQEVAPTPPSSVVESELVPVKEDLSPAVNPVLETTPEPKRPPNESQEVLELRRKVAALEQQMLSKKSEVITENQSNKGVESKIGQLEKEIERLARLVRTAPESSLSPPNPPPLMRPPENQITDAAPQPSAQNTPAPPTRPKLGQAFDKKR